MTLNDYGTIFSLIIGSAAFILGIMNYRRDKHKLLIELIRCQSTFPKVKVINIGRRSVYVTKVGVIYKDTFFNAKNLPLNKDVIEEGGDPLIYYLTEDLPEEAWGQARGMVIDGQGKTWYSSRKYIYLNDDLSTIKRNVP